MYLSFGLFLTALLWGGYSLIVYLGIPIHQLVYLTPDDVRTWDVACGSASTTGVYLCKGAALLFPFLTTTFKMASPFYLYTILSAFVFAGFLLYAGYKTGRFQISTQWRPLGLVLLFIASVWLLGTTFSVGSLYNQMTPANARMTDANGNQILQPFSRFYEPLPQVYNGAGPEALAELQANFKELQDGGCLADSGMMTQNGAHLYDLSFFCMQKSFFGRVGVQIFMVSWLLLLFLALGRLLLVHALRITHLRPLLLAVFSIGVGALGLVAILWSLGVMAQLNTTVVRIVFFGLPILLFQQSWWWLKQGWEKKIDVEFSFKNWHNLLAWLLITYIALNFLNVVRPFPIGWDDLGSYLNRPRLLASYGHFIPSMSQFQWEYLTSLGFLIFGYDSWVGSTFAMQINWVAGLIAVLSVYVLARTFFGKGHGIIAAMFYYFLPMTGHFSFADMKIDNASFFTTALAVTAALVYMFPRVEGEQEGEVKERDWKLLIIAGLLAGFSFAIKPTAILGMLMVGSLVTGAIMGPLGFTGAAILGFALLQKFGPLNLKDVLMRSGFQWDLSPSVLVAITAVTGLAFLGYAIYRNKTLVRPLLIAAGSFIAGVLISIAPWAIHNMSLAETITVGSTLSAQDRTTTQIFYLQKEELGSQGVPDYLPVRVLPPELKLDPDNPVCKTSARTEELDRYWGFDQGIGHYLGLAWRQVMNLDTFGYYVTFTPALLLFPLLLLLPYFWSKEGRWLRLLFVGTTVFFAQWTLVGNGIAWYGIGMFLGIAIAMEAFLVYAPDQQNRWLMRFLLTMGIIICLTNRLWQFDTQKNLFEYPMGKISASALREVTIPDYDDIREIVVGRHEALTDTPYTYRVGTFISYFIPRNREIFPLADHQLNFFSCLNQEQNHALTLRRLKALGFNSIIFDTNTQTIEKDPNGSLHQKVNKFLEFANDPSINLDLVVNDPSNGIAYIVLPMDAGTGSLALPK